MLIARNFSDLYELCDFIRENNIDVYSEDVKYLGEYVFSPTQSFSCNGNVIAFCNAVCYATNARPPKYTIHYEDNKNNVGPLQAHYVKDFSED